MLNEINLLSKFIDVHIADVNGKHCILSASEEDNDIVLSQARELGLETTVEKVPFSLTVSYYKIFVS